MACGEPKVAVPDPKVGFPPKSGDPPKEGAPPNAGEVVCVWPNDPKALGGGLLGPAAAFPKPLDGAGEPKPPDAGAEAPKVLPPPKTFRLALADEGVPPSPIPPNIPLPPNPLGVEADGVPGACGAVVAACEAPNTGLPVLALACPNTGADPNAGFPPNVEVPPAELPNNPNDDVVVVGACPNVF